MRSCLARTLGRGAPSRSSQSLGRHLSLNVRTMLTAPVSVHVGAVQTCLCNFQTGALHHPSISGVLISHCASAALPARLHAARRRAKSHSTHPNMSARAHRGLPVPARPSRHVNPVPPAPPRTRIDPAAAPAGRAHPRRLPRFARRRKRPMGGPLPLPAAAASGRCAADRGARAGAFSASISSRQGRGSDLLADARLGASSSLPARRHASGLSSGAARPQCVALPRRARRHGCAAMIPSRPNGAATGAPPSWGVRTRRAGAHARRRGGGKGACSVGEGFRGRTRYTPRS